MNEDEELATIASIFKDNRESYWLVQLRVEENGKKLDEINTTLSLIHRLVLRIESIFSAVLLLNTIFWIAFTLGRM